MKLMPTTLGADRKRLAILGLLVVVLGAVYWMNRSPSAPEAGPSSGGRVASPAALNPAGPRTIPPMPAPPVRTARESASTADDFRPSLKLKEGIDVSRIDPALKIDLLARLQSVPLEGGSRSIFEFYQPPAPPPQPKSAAAKPGPITATPVIPAGSPASPTAKPPAPPPPPIPFKFYGYANSARNGVRRAFFLDGDDIFVAGENDLIRNRYKIIRIGVNSAVVEDTTNKSQQTLPLVEELAG